MASEVSGLHGHVHRSYAELGVSVFTPPPAGFDPLTASEDDLRRHGYLPRPDRDIHPKHYEQWRRLVTQVTNIVVPEFATVPVVSAVASGQGHPEPFPTSGTSGNWAGTVMFPDFFDRVNSVFGNWTVPAILPVAGESLPFICASWIGIDGFAAGSNPAPASLVQAGTTRLLTAFPMADLTYPWWEWVPNGPTTITNLPVRPGDVMNCAILLTSEMTASFHFANLTRGVSTSFMKVSPDQTEAAGICAEWIVELPTGTLQGHPLHLAQYGSVYFDGCRVHTRSGTNLESGSGELLTMVNADNSPISIPERLGDEAFKVDFLSGHSFE